MKLGMNRSGVRAETRETKGCILVTNELREADGAHRSKYILKATGMMIIT
jgi:hypothetical protein